MSDALDERRAEGFVAAAVLVAPLLLGRVFPGRLPLDVWFRSVPLVALLAATVLLHSLLRGAIARHAQTLAITAAFVLLALESPSTTTRAVTLSMGLFGGLVAWKGPIERRGFRRALIVVCTVAIFAFWRSLDRVHGFLAFQILWTCEVMASRPERTFVDCHRGMCSFMSNVPPEQLALETRARNARLVGAGWFAGGTLLLVLAVALSRFRLPDMGHHPFARLLTKPIETIVDSLTATTRFLCSHCGRYLVLGGVVRAVGIPVEAPIGNMFRVTNLMEFWANANRWRWKMLKSIWVEHFFPLRRDLLGAFSIVAIFVVSAIEHATGSRMHGVLPWTWLSRWLVYGVLAAGTYYWMMLRIGWRMDAIVAGTHVARAPNVLDRLVDVICFFLVMVTIGFLMLVIR